LVSVIIPTYNRARWILEAIDSVLGQTYGNVQLVVVDDGSTDDTRDMLRRRDGRVTVIHTGHNRGPAAARNRGISAAAGDLIAFLDSDDLWLPEKLSVQVRYFTDHPDCRVCQTEELWIRNGVRVNPMRKHAKHAGWIFNPCLARCIVSPSAVMLHRSVFECVGLFDEAMPACEDYDLWLRIAPVYEIHLITRPLIIKRGGHADQQSRRIPHLDRWRIHALCKILESDLLAHDQYAEACAALAAKCRVYGNGCIKHGRRAEGLHYLGLPSRYQAQDEREPCHEPCVLS